MSCVYKHTFPNGAVYIGKTNVRPEERWLNGMGYRKSPLMFAAIVKYGWDNIKHEILHDNLTPEEATEIEKELIQKYCLTSELTYNVQHTPAQYVAQEATHYIPPQIPAQEPAHKSTEKLPRTVRCGRSAHIKEYIVPITPKPEGVHEWPIDVYDRHGNYIAQFNNAKLASEELSVNHGDIISCCKGVKPDGMRKYQVKGYIFRYAQIKKEAMV